MTFSRRSFMAAGAAGTVLAALPLRLLASTDAQAAIAAFTGGAEPADGGLSLTTPEIAENGNTVPVEVSADGAKRIMIIADGNPNPGVCTFHFGALAASSTAKTRIRLAGTQNVLAVAELADGSFVSASRPVKVTIGGCGG